jgi:hypothetical protein
MWIRLIRYGMTEERMPCKESTTSYFHQHRLGPLTQKALGRGRPAQVKQKKSCPLRKNHFQDEEAVWVWAEIPVGAGFAEGRSGKVVLGVPGGAFPAGGGECRQHHAQLCPHAQVHGRQKEVLRGCYTRWGTAPYIFPFLSALRASDTLAKEEIHPDCVWCPAIQDQPPTNMCPTSIRLQVSLTTPQGSANRWSMHAGPHYGLKLSLIMCPGNARVKDCLEAHRYDAGFSAECKEEFEKMMEARSQDFRLDSSLRDACAEDINLVCGLEKVRGSVLISTGRDIASLP